MTWERPKEEVEGVEWEEDEEMLWRGSDAVCVSLSLTQRVAARCGTLHVKVVALVETPSFGPVGKVVGGGLFERQLFG